ncbi:unnamed protein product [Rotaria magnacalcarata]|uniref:Uncharacterized protein n=3 Tax=Rotaria magnacalcarata TaxID=392030 RepID=A0A815ZML5_9BILA|nr:unnamed protein product [Rotaria magnacalcarata]CAF3813704.1 unnamed protein product [Rotaria magnacalcarata]CAF3857092.1 unnamed protein product [Rotaria magnacalcarata]CAF3908379.1 unnamed protein product [Rotaria magnacalcarata]CAF4132621.1 unnamed protein product [Rotaria magnacalcarata]
MTTMFKKHFGPEYVTMCEHNKLGMVDADLLRCLSCDLIPKLLIEKYLVEICRSQNVTFEPDPTIMAQDEFWTIGQRYVQPPTNPQPQYPNINFGPSIPPPQLPPPSSSASGPRLGFNADYGAKTPFNDPFPQVPSANDRSTPPGNHGGSDDPGFDDLARRFEDLKNRK